MSGSVLNRVVTLLHRKFSRECEWREKKNMPELSRFFGIIIRMYMEAEGPHHLPHFHAYYHDEVAVVRLEPVVYSQDRLRYQLRRWSKQI